MAKRPAASADEPSDDDIVVSEALKRFKRTQEWEAVAERRWIADTKFENGDSDNMYQWPEAVRSSRAFGTDDERPCLTVNKTRQHVLQIINDARQNRTHIKFRPVGGGATYEAAQIFDGIVRHIEYISNAQQAYATATRHQVIGGIGYFRITTDYAGPDTFDQEIYIKRVKNPLSVYLDPDIQEADGSDARFGFVFEDVPKDEFETRYPEHKEVAKAALDNEFEWITADHVRVAEYFRVKETKDRLISFINPDTGERVQVKESELPRKFRKGLLQDIIDDPDTVVREVMDRKVEWFKIAGHEIIERRPWLGKYVPICRMPGEETVIDGEMDRKGHVRALKDPQRSYNYNVSGQAESVALQTKTPWKAPVAAIEGYETYWQNANLQNYAVLPYNHMDDAGNPIPAPERTDPPTASQAFQIGMTNAANDMMLVSGQYQADFGAPSNEKSGVAIQQRQRQSSTATYHYVDHQAMAIRFGGKVVADLIPRVYDTKRVIKIMAEDGSDSEVTLDPHAAQAYLQEQQKNADAAKQVIFNPNIGRYDIEADVGPDYATRRQEAFNALSQIAGSNQELMLIIGDLLFKSADFQYADEIAQRLERMVPAEAKGEGPPPELLKLQQMLQSQGQLIEAMTEKLKEKEQALKAKGGDMAIGVYDAETKRISALKDVLSVDPNGLLALVRQAVAEAMAGSPVPPQPMEGMAA